MRCADVRRAEQCARSLVAQLLKVSGEVTCSARQMVGDVLDADELRRKLDDELSCSGPEVTSVVSSGLLAGGREGLTGDPASDAIHEAAPRSRVEGSEVTPDRSEVQRSFFHTRNQARCGKGFPLDVANCSRREAASGESEVEPEVEPTDPGADGEDSEFGT